MCRTNPNPLSSKSKSEIEPPPPATMDSTSSSAVAVTAGAAPPPYPSSVESSPRSRTAEQSPFFDDPLPSPSPSKLRLMCSFGGRIVPRPTDKSLCYLGGETRMVSLDRTSSLPDLLSRLSRSLLQSRPFTLKYQLPHEDLDSLISVTHDEDLDNLLDEYDRLHHSGSTSKSSRIRLFLFPSKSESAPSSITTISSLLDDSKSDTWFVDALNGALDRGMSVDTLLGLEDDSSVHSRATDPVLTRPDSSNKMLPDSPMLDTTSSFGSASSGAYISNLPPIRLRAEDRPPDSAVTAGQEMLKEMGFAEHAPAVPAPPIISPTGNDGYAVQGDEDDDEDEDDNGENRHGNSKKPKPPVASTAQQKAAVSDPNGTRGAYYQDKVLPVAGAVTAIAATPVVPAAVAPAAVAPAVAAVTDPSYRGYLMPEQIQYQQQQYHQQQQQQLQQPPPQQQQQFAHYINPATGAVVPMPAYYQLPIQQPHHYDPQMQMYFMPMRPNAPYNLPPIQPGLGDAAGAPPKTGAVIPNSVGGPAVPLPKVAARPEMPVNPANMYRVAPGAAPGPPAQAPQLIHVTPDQAQAYAGMGYQIVHHNQPHYPTQSATAMTNYGYEYATDPLPPQMYYTQATSQPQLSSQFQSMASTAAPVIPDASLAPQAQLQPQARS